MSSPTRSRRLCLSLVALAAALVIAAGAAGCAGQGSSRGEPADPAAAESGAELWSASCRRCHAVRDPADYTDAQWRLVMMHMRVRANLTGSEYRQILAFLTSGQ